MWDFYKRLLFSAGRVLGVDPGSYREEIQAHMPRKESRATLALKEE